MVFPVVKRRAKCLDCMQSVFLLGHEAGLCAGRGLKTHEEGLGRRIVRARRKHFSVVTMLPLKLRKRV